MLLSDLVQSDVAILGLGEEGLSVLRCLRDLAPNKRICLYAEKSPGSDTLARLDPSVDELHVGPLDAQALSQHQILVRSPGISPYRAEFRAAKQAGACLTTASSIWFAQNPEARTVCITGTKGKSTTSALVHHLLCEAGVVAELAGNIGRSLLECEADSADWWVVELSSYQLHDLHAAPRVSAVLNISDEHLDWHQGRENYQHDKLRLADLAPDSLLVANHKDPMLRRHFLARPNVSWFDDPQAIHSQGRAVYDRGQLLLDHVPDHFPGAHNVSNLVAALTIARAVAPLPKDLGATLARFNPLPHRLALVAELNGLRFYDDSLSTTPVATLAALEALQGSPVTLLVGGLDRGLDWAICMERFRRANLFAIIGMPDNGPALLEQFRKSGISPEGGLHDRDRLPDAVSLARQLTPAGGIVLLSPGAPSFPQYANYKERAAAFLSAVQGMQAPPESLNQAR